MNFLSLDLECHGMEWAWTVVVDVAIENWHLDKMELCYAFYEEQWCQRDSYCGERDSRVLFIMFLHFSLMLVKDG